MNEQERKERTERLAKRYGRSASIQNDAQMKRGPGGPRGGPGGHHRGMMGGKPKNLRKTIGRLMSYLSQDVWRLVIVFVFLILSAAASLAGSYMLRPIINTYIVPTDGSAGDPIGLARALLVMGLVYLVGITATYLQSRLMVNIAQRAVYSIRNDLFSKMQKLPLRYFDNNTTGELMSRYTNDVDTIGDMLNTTLVQIVSGVISVIGTFSLMLYTNVWLTLITVVMFPIMTKAAAAIGSRSRKFFGAQQTAIGAMNGYIQETVSGQKVVKVFNHEAMTEEEFGLLNDDLRQKQIHAQFFGGIMGPVMNNLSQLSYSLTAMIGGLLCVLRGFDVGGLAVFVNFSRQFSQPINQLSNQMTVIFSALAGAERVFAVMDQKPEQEGEEGKRELQQVTGAVTLEHVTFGYTPEKVILKDINLYAKPGQKIAFVGSTGAGKTTITNLLNRFYDIQEGKICFDGVDIREYTKDSLRRNIAMVLQDTHLFTGTVRENIRYGRLDATDEEVEQAAKTASAHSFIMRLPEGYDTMIVGDGSNLSQGQRQLLNIARASISKAPILILDEATSSIDTRTEKHIEHGMDRLMKNRTTFVIAHRLSTVKNADVIMVLEQGEIIERGTHEELLALKGRYYNLYTGKAELD